MENVVRNLRVLWRAESIIADVRLRQMMVRSGLRGAAVLLGLFAFLMANLAVFFALQQIWGAIWAAAAVSAGNVLLAGILLFAAGRTAPGREMELALEVRNNALENLEADALVVQAQLVELREEIRGVRRAITGFAHHPLDNLLPNLLVPLAGAIAKGLKKSDAAKD